MSKVVKDESFTTLDIAIPPICIFFRKNYNTAFFLCPYGSKRLVILVFSVVFYRYDYCVTQNVKWRIFMLVCDYIVESIDGDYAHLRRTDLSEEELKLVARALLPFEITEGCRLHYEMMQYSIID